MYRFKTSHLFIVPSFILSLLKCLILNTCGRLTTSALHLFCIFLVIVCTCNNMSSVVCAGLNVNKPGNNELQFSDEQDIPEKENNLLSLAGSSQNQASSINLKGEDNKKDDGGTFSLLSLFSKTKGQRVVQLTGRTKPLWNLTVQSENRARLENSKNWAQWFVNNFLHNTNSYTKRQNKGLAKYSKYRLPKLPRITTPPTTTEFIPDDDEMNTATENPKKRTTPRPDINDSKSRVNLSVRREPGARYTNGTLCPTEFEERFCWSDGSCPWYDTCKVVNCVISCVRRKGEEWLSVKHDSVGIHLRDVKLVEEKPQPKKNSKPGKGKGKNPKQDKGKDKKNQKEKEKVSKNKGKPPTSSKNKIKS